jgi:hypothetical protein
MPCLHNPCTGYRLQWLAYANGTDSDPCSDHSALLPPLVESVRGGNVVKEAVGALGAGGC